MTAAGEIDLWRFWKGQALLATGQVKEAAAYVQKIENREQADALESLVQRAISGQNSDRTPTIEFLEKRFARTQDPLDLFDLCEAYYDAKNWSAIAKHAKEVLEGIGTAAALRLAVESAHRVGDFRLCLELLEGRENLFPTSRLPSDLRRLRVLCWRKEGRLEQAIPEAEALARETGDSSDVLTLVAVRLEGADPKGAVIEARALLKRADVAPEHHLQLAHVLKVEDQSAAIAHLEKAMASGDRSPSFVAGALDLIFRLNREEKFAELQPALQHSATLGGAIELAGPERMIEMMRASAERQQETEGLYAEGRIPLHWALELIGGTLGQAYEQRFNPTASGVHWPPAPPLFIRHGGRIPPVPRGIKTLHVDISSLLIASQLDLLDAIEKAFAPVYLPPSVIPALYHEIAQTQSHQPSKLEEARLIVALLAEGKLRVAPVTSSNSEAETGRPTCDWLALLKAAQEAEGFVVDYLPLSTGFPATPVKLTDIESKSVTDCASVLSALNTTGKLTALEHGKAIRQLGAFASRVSVHEPPLNSSLYLHGNIVEVLAGAGILGKACEYFTVYTEPREQRQSEAVIDYEARCSQLRGRLRGLLDRIQRGLGATWRQLPALAERPEQHLGHESRCLSELIAVERLPDTFVWIDDRFLNAFGYCGGNPIITIYGMLLELRARGLLDNGDLFARLHVLRRANLRHLPTTSEEILHLLSSTRFAETEIVETPELMVLRQYFAACLSERGRLQMPPPPDGVPNPHGEAGYILSILNTVRDSLAALWSKVNADNLAQVTARADWLLRNLWFESTSLPWLQKKEERHSELVAPLLGAALAQLYTQGLSLAGKWKHAGKPGQPPRTLYFQWLQNRFANDTESVKETARHLAKVFCSDWMMNRRSEQEQSAFRILFGELLEDLPRDLRLALPLSKESLARLGIQQYDSVNIEGWNFEVRDFWRAAEKAVRAGSSRITSRKEPKQFTLRYVQEGTDPVLHFSTVDPAADYALSDEAFRALDRSEEVRRTVLRSHPEWFDCAERIFHQHADRIAAICDAPERLRQLEQWRSGSAAHCYASLWQKQGSGESVNLSHFEPPSVRGLLNHVRLNDPPSDGELTTSLQNASEALLREVGFEETFRRLAAFPVRMPPAVRTAYEALSSEQQAVWRSGAIRDLTSPVARIHVMSFISRADQASACEVIEALAGPEGEVTFEAFRALLLWTLGRLEIRTECAALPAAALLTVSWLHAERLYELLTAISSPQTIRQFFSDASRPTWRDVLRSRPELSTDVSHPGRLRLRGLILHGVAIGLDPALLDDAQGKRVRDLLRGLCFESADAVPVAHSDLMNPADWHRNGLCSFLHGDRGSLLESWLGEDAESLSTSLIAEIARKSIAALNSSLTEEPVHWQMLAHILGLVSPPETVREPLLTLLSNKHIDDLALLEPEPRRVALYFLMQQVSHSPEALRPLREQLVKLARRLGEAAGNGLATRQDATLLVECTHFLSTTRGNADDSAREFGTIMLELLTVWPAIVDEVWVTLRGLIARLPASMLATLWPLIFELRKMARK